MNKSIFLRLIILSAVLSSCYFRIYRNINSSKDLFWDTMVYYCGPLIFNQKGNGYGNLVECSQDLVNFKFVYLPIYLRLLDFDFLSPITFQIAWIAFLTISILIIIFILTKIYDEFSYSKCLLISLFSFSAIPFYGYLSGNISNILYLFIAIGILTTLSKKINIIRLGLFLIAIPSLFKIHMILFMIVPIIYVPKAEIKNILMLIIAPFVMIFMNKYLYPNEFELLKSNIKILPYVGDMGVGSMQFINYLNSNILNLSESFKSGKHNWEISSNEIRNGHFIFDYILYLILLTFITYKTFSLRFKKLSLNLKTDINLKVSIALIATLIIIPRLKQYDMLLFSIPTFYLVNSSLFNDSIKDLFNNLNPNYIVQLFNILVLGFYVVSGDNYFIYPLIFIIYVLCIRKFKKDSI